MRAELAPAHIKAIDHVQLAMPAGAEAEARAFYAGILGIPEVAKPANLALRGGCWFVRGSLQIHLGADPEFRPARKAHPALLVENLGGFRTVLERAGVACRDEVPLNGYERIYIDDPFGNRIELLEPKPPAA